MARHLRDAPRATRSADGVAGVRRTHRRGALRPARLDAPAVRGGARRRRLSVGSRRGRHEERGRGPCRGHGRAGAHRIPAERRPVVPRGRRRGGRVRGRRDALAARGAHRHPAHLQRQRGRRRAAASAPTAARCSVSRSARRAPCRCRWWRPGEAGHASVPTLGRNAVPLLAQLLPRLGDGMPEPSAGPRGDRDAERSCSAARNPTCGARWPRPTRCTTVWARRSWR